MRTEESEWFKGGENLKIRLFGRTIEIKNSSLPRLSDDSTWTNYLSGRGYQVSSDTALQTATVIRCVDVVAKTLASLPLVIFKNTSNGKEKADRHPLYKLLYRLPNPETAAYDFWMMYLYNLILTPGAYAMVKRDTNGFITELWNIPTRNAQLRRNSRTGERFLDVFNGDGLVERLYPGSFMYTPNTRFSDSDNPLDPVRMASNVLGLTMALDGYAKDFFENGTNLGGFVEYPGAMSDRAFQNFKDSWEKTYSGVKNHHKIAFLESGIKFNQLGKNPNDSQALESRKHQVTEICRIFGVPPHKVFDLERATFSNIEQQNIEFAQESIAPMAVRVEQTIFKDLLTTNEQRNYYAKFNINALLRGDMVTRTQYYHMMRQDGIMSANEIRQLEEMNNIPTEHGGDDYLINGNMISLENARNNLPKSMQSKGGGTA